MQRESDIPVWLVFKNLLTQSILKSTMEDHTYLQQHETFSPHIQCAMHLYFKTVKSTCKEAAPYTNFLKDSYKKGILQWSVYINFTFIWMPQESNIAN